MVREQLERMFPGYRDDIMNDDSLLKLPGETQIDSLLRTVETSVPYETKNNLYKDQA